ncbi:phosphatidylglycerophosphatase A [candidate division WOR-3 bacterium]|uniref:Phosphatidylglycerophosphatase A n=1 Tax=candidate division WOR-3 bacterium TaxID=2052148 RepID=A0A937XGE1_UNCW3|nr:phosphatidylglycerophosphatase A [candidate division WOR-3 bacterium]
MGAEVPEQAPPLGRTRFFLEALVGSGLFTGYFPIAPATATSLFVLLPAFFLARLPVWNAATAVLLFFVGVPIATDLERVWGKDPHRVTIDEVVGTLVTFFLNPVSLWGLGVGFLLWRFFDIVKLPFIDKSQRLPGGWGIMMDDVLAGICANLVLRLVLLLLPVLRYH